MRQLTSTQRSFLYALLEEQDPRHRSFFLLDREDGIPNWFRWADLDAFAELGWVKYEYGGYCPYHPTAAVMLTVTLTETGYRQAVAALSPTSDVVPSPSSPEEPSTIDRPTGNTTQQQVLTEYLNNCTGTVDRETLLEVLQTEGFKPAGNPNAMKRKLRIYQDNHPHRTMTVHNIGAITLDPDP